MSHAELKKTQKTIFNFKNSKLNQKKISMVTCYDAAFAKIINKTDIDAVLVGDSLGNVVMGFDNTLSVTMEHMLHHIACVARGLSGPLLCADLPFLSYTDCESALHNAGRLVQEGGAHAVKLEGGKDFVPQIVALVKNGIPVMGHLGLTPQSVHALGGYRVQGKTTEDQARMLEDAQAIENAGAFSLVLEMVPKTLAEKIAKTLKIPVIGIGAGAECDGQVLVLHDLLGINADFAPKFLKKYLNLSQLVEQALNAYDHDVKNKLFPTSEQSF